MRRLFALILALVLLAGFAAAQGTIDAAELALSMARYIPQMRGVQQAGGEVMWADSRLQSECSMMVHASELEAECYMLAQCSKKCAVRAVGCCTIALESSLPLEDIENYEQVLADLLGVRLEPPVYILNVNTGKFHERFCRSVEDMKDSNKLPYAGERALVIDYGYVPCKNCCP